MPKCEDCQKELTDDDAVPFEVYDKQKGLWEIAGYVCVKCLGVVEDEDNLGSE